MVCCLTAPSHYLSQCWLPISEDLWHSSEANLTASTQISDLHNEFDSYTFKIIATSFRGQTDGGRTCQLTEAARCIIWSNAGLLLTEPLETYFSKISVEIQYFTSQTLTVQIYRLQVRLHKSMACICTWFEAMSNEKMCENILDQMWFSGWLFSLVIVAFHVTHAKFPSAHQD